MLRLFGRRQLASALQGSLRGLPSLEFLTYGADESLGSSACGLLHCRSFAWGQRGEASSPQKEHRRPSRPRQERPRVPGSEFPPRHRPAHATSAGTDTTARLKAARSCAEVLRVVQLGGKLRVGELTTAANSMARLHQHGGQTGEQLAANQAAFRQLVAASFQRLTAFDLWACAQYLWAATRLEAPFSPQQLTAWEQRAAQLLEAAKEQQPNSKRAAGGAQAISNILLAYATAGQQPDSELAAALQHRLPLLLLHGTDQSVANGLWGWSKLGRQLDKQLTAAAHEAVQRTAANMSPQGVSNTMHAFAKGGWPLGGTGKAALLQQLPRTLLHGSEQDVANSLWSLSTLGRQQLTGGLAEAAEAAVQRTAADMSTQNIASTLWAFAKSGWPLGSVAQAALRQQLPHTLLHGKPQEVANSLGGWSKLGCPMDKQLAAVADAAVQRTAASMNLPDVRQLLEVFSTAGWRLGTAAEVELARAARRVGLLASHA